MNDPSAFIANPEVYESPTPLIVLHVAPQSVETFGKVLLYVAIKTLPSAEDFKSRLDEVAVAVVVSQVEPPFELTKTKVFDVAQVVASLFPSLDIATVRKSTEVAHRFRLRMSEAVVPPLEE